MIRGTGMSRGRESWRYGMDNNLTIELAPFAVADGVGTDELLEASDRLERIFLTKAEGYLGRVLVQKDSRTWADIVFWRSDEHASKAMMAAASSETCRAYFQCMAAEDHGDAGKGVTLYRSVRSYGAVPPVA
jgi:hypothetical protein